MEPHGPLILTRPILPPGPRPPPVSKIPGGDYIHRPVNPYLNDGSNFNHMAIPAPRPSSEKQQPGFEIDKGFIRGDRPKFSSDQHINVSPY